MTRFAPQVSLEATLLGVGSGVPAVERFAHEQLDQVERRWDTKVRPLVLAAAGNNSASRSDSYGAAATTFSRPLSELDWVRDLKNADVLVIAGDSGPAMCHQVPRLVAAARRSGIPVITGVMELADVRPFERGIDFFTSGALGDCNILIPQAPTLRRRLAAIEGSAKLDAHAVDDRLRCLIHARLARDRMKRLTKFLGDLFVPSGLECYVEEIRANVPSQDRWVPPLARLE